MNRYTGMKLQWFYYLSSLIEQMTFQTLPITQMVGNFRTFTVTTLNERLAHSREQKLSMNGYVSIYLRLLNCSKPIYGSYQDFYYLRQATNISLNFYFDAPHRSENHSSKSTGRYPRAFNSLYLLQVLHFYTTLPYQCPLIFYQVIIIMWYTPQPSSWNYFIWK